MCSKTCQFCSSHHVHYDEIDEVIQHDGCICDNNDAGDNHMYSCFEGITPSNLKSCEFCKGDKEQVFGL